MTDQVHYLNAASDGGDGTTSATSGPNAAYTTFGDFKTARVTDLVTAAVNQILWVAAGEYLESWDDSGWTTDATHRLKVMAEDTYCWKPDFSEGPVFKAATSGSSSVIVLSQDTDLVGVGAWNTSANSSTRGISISGVLPFPDSCMAKGGTNSSSDSWNFTGASIRGRNLVGVDATRRNFAIANFTAGTLENCGSINAGVMGFYRGGTGGTKVILKNCWEINTTVSGYTGYSPSGGFDATNSSHNSSYDGTAVGVNIITNALTAAAFADAGGSDYRHTAAGALKGTGLDLSGTFTTSINGVVRTSAFDAGPYAYEEVPNIKPVADAGPDQLDQIVGAEVTTDGTSSSDPDGSVSAYAWTFASKPAGSTATLVDEDTANATFTPDLEGIYVLQLIVTDDEALDSDPDTVRVLALPLGIQGQDLPNSGDDGASVWFQGGSPLVSLPTDNTTLFYVESNTQPSHGSVIMRSDGSFTYSADDEYTGPDSFTFIYRKDGVAQAEQTVNLSVGITGVVGGDNEVTRKIHRIRYLHL